MNNNLKELPYAQWLETALQELVTLPVKGLCISAALEDGYVYTNYYQISTNDKITIAGYIQQHATIDTLRANGFIKDEEEEE